ncbi:hypothetical protein EPO34_02610 [Patescibacteria group bacterium]|nr:MAG: hypothetical protein EPO34_02610 [Patescibacteria group bacterium]
MPTETPGHRRHLAKALALALLVVALAGAGCTDEPVQPLPDGVERISLGGAVTARFTTPLGWSVREPISNVWHASPDGNTARWNELLCAMKLYESPFAIRTDEDLKEFANSLRDDGDLPAGVGDENTFTTLRGNVAFRRLVETENVMVLAQRFVVIDPRTVIEVSNTVRSELVADAQAQPISDACDGIVDSLEIER